MRGDDGLKIWGEIGVKMGFFWPVSTYLDTIETTNKIKNRL